MASEPRAAAIELAREFVGGGVPKIGSDDLGYLLAAYDQMEADRDRLADAIERVRQYGEQRINDLYAMHATVRGKRDVAEALEFTALDICQMLEVLDQGSAGYPHCEPGKVDAAAATAAPLPADPASHHWLTLAIEQGRLSAHLTCTAPPDSLCRLDCAVRDCEQEEPPPHTAHDGMSVHRAIDSGRCHVAEAFSNAGGLYPDDDGSDTARCYEGIPGPLGTIPVDAWLGEAGPGWDLLHRHATDADADWTAQDEARHQAQQQPPWEPTAAVQFRAGFETARRAMDGAQ